MNWFVRNWSGVVVGVGVTLLAMSCSGCASLPRGQHGEALNIRHGWLEVAQISDRCQWQQREYAARVTCSL